VAAVYRGYIAIEKGFFFPTDYSIPASAVAILREGLTLLLLVVWDLAGPDPRDFSQKMLDIEGFEHDLHPHRLEVGLELLDHLDGRRAHDDGNLPGSRIELEQLQELPAAPLIEDDEIEQDQVRSVLTRASITSISDVNRSVLTR
jgi:hypothetical protein